MGKGGSSSVFLAEHLELKVYRAIKRIRKNLIYFDQIIQEARILKNLRHPCIPIIYDIEFDEEYCYIILEYIEGESLKTVCLYPDSITKQSIIDYAIQICELFRYLHGKEQPILYLDLKPENIIIKDGILKLIDFGSAIYKRKIISSKYRLGTRGYASPEQCSGALLDERSDIYSIGVLLYFLITKEKPDTDIAKKCGIGLLGDMIFKCLQACPSERYQSIEELHNELLYLQKEQKERRRSQYSLKIAVAGTQRRIGATHTAILLTALFNQLGEKAIYIDRTDDRIVEKILEFSEEKIYFNEKKEVVKIKDCFFLLNPEREEELEDYLLVLDFGVLKREKEECLLDSDKIYVVAGDKPWEINYTNKWINRFTHLKKVKWLWNFSAEKQKNQSSIPYVQNPFSISPLQKKKLSKWIKHL